MPAFGVFAQGEEYGHGVHEKTLTCIVNARSQQYPRTSDTAGSENNGIAEYLFTGFHFHAQDLFPGIIENKPVNRGRDPQFSAIFLNGLIHIAPRGPLCVPGTAQHAPVASQFALLGVDKFFLFLEVGTHIFSGLHHSLKTRISITVVKFRGKRFNTDFLFDFIGLGPEIDTHLFYKFFRGIENVTLVYHGRTAHSESPFHYDTFFGPVEHKKPFR